MRTLIIFLLFLTPVVAMGQDSTKSEKPVEIKLLPQTVAQLENFDKTRTELQRQFNDTNAAQQLFIAGIVQGNGIVLTERDSVVLQPPNKILILRKKKP